jgi:hypothetical protein
MKADREDEPMVGIVVTISPSFSLEHSKHDKVQNDTLSYPA